MASGSRSMSGFDSCSRVFLSPRLVSAPRTMECAQPGAAIIPISTPTWSSGLGTNTSIRTPSWGWRTTPAVTGSRHADRTRCGGAGLLGAQEHGVVREAEAAVPRRGVQPFQVANFNTPQTIVFTSATSEPSPAAVVITGTSTTYAVFSSG